MERRRLLIIWSGIGGVVWVSAILVGLTTGVKISRLGILVLVPILTLALIPVLLSPLVLIMWSTVVISVEIL